MRRLFFITFLIPGLLLAQHSIKGEFSPAKDYNVLLLYKVTPTISEYVSSTKVDEEGHFEFELDSTVVKGVYRIVYAVPQEDYNFDIIYNGKEDIELRFNSETGVAYKSSFENKLLASYTNSMSMVTHSIGNYFRQKSKDTTALKAIFKTQKETQSSYEEAARGTIVFEFIKANKPYTPDKYLDIRAYISALKAHYFDAIDFNNATLQSSNFLSEKMLNYVFGMSSKSKDNLTSYKTNIDAFCDKMKTVPKEIKRVLLLDLWQQMVDLKLEPVANYISETYLMDVAVALNDQELLHALILYKDLSNGAKAPDFSIELIENNKKVTKKLSQLDAAEQYIIVFWSSGCSHCLDEVPQLQTFIKSKEKNNVKVVAIGLEDEPIAWNALIEKYPEFIHVYGKDKWDNETANNYGVTSTPTYFVLNKNKEIIAKPENFDAVKAFFDKD
ncbi:TlpA disulfide reductase family protein [Tamlana sp. 2201CG12-4]|uniref:TlpA family protein disulfide reductase n=1 Tax=Tamlana sp. 2201CG12-4 TaxID=3112582 RepID=UPI002DBCE3F6|nr:TlpA disulfide reductase family protein [Tamlana sp. 2201CG12-4]MEC3906417.1 TlpA disulfide reductase family protein [Tamlana sp. 2201CG12-4]